MLAKLGKEKQERDEELEKLFFGAEGNQKKKVLLQKRLKEANDKAEELRDKVDYYQKLESSHNRVFAEKRKFMKELIFNESIAGAMLSSATAKSTLSLAQDINKKLKRR